MPQVNEFSWFLCSVYFLLMMFLLLFWFNFFRECILFKVNKISKLFFTLII